MSASLDYSKLSTWENVDPVIASARISAEGSGGINMGAMVASIEVFEKIADIPKRAQFFLNCETLNLRGWKFHAAYKYHSHENCDAFIQAVLNSDQAMLAVVAKIEADMR